jgi:hypothetical protein
VCVRVCVVVCACVRVYTTHASIADASGAHVCICM